MIDRNIDRASRASLMTLARCGAYLKRITDGAEIFSPRNTFTAAVARIDEKTFSHALASGWLRQTSKEVWELSRQGVAAIRSARSGLTAAKTGRKTGRASPPGRQQDSVPAVNPAESPLAWLSRRRDKDGNPLLSDAQFQAGERLRGDFWFAQLTPRVTASWNPAASSRRERRAAPGAGVELQDHVVAAKERVHRALKAVGPELAGILIDVCCHLKGIEDTERELCWPQRSGKVVLQLALTRLARHYGLLTDGSELYSPRPRTRHWGAPGYRPTADHWR
jgi:hypothetical protein